MATINKFEELKAWQEARKLCYEINNQILKKKDISFSFKDQIDSSSGSIMDNIAEGFERSGNKEFRQFLTVAKGSCGEVRSQLYRAIDRDYISQAVYNNLNNSAENISRMIAGLIKYINSSDFKGSKFNVSEEEQIYLINKSDISDNEH